MIRARHNRFMTSAHPRITIEHDKREGKPCIRRMRITVNDVLGWLSHGVTEDFAAVYAFAAEMADMAYSHR
jgi:uncharacterized protein (DUF433 family)